MVITKALKFYINSSMHVALAVVAFSIITIVNFNIALDPYLLLFTFFATITGYNYIKYAEIAKFQHFSLSKNLKAIQILSLSAFIGLIITLFFQNWEVLLTSAILGFVTFLYAFPLPKNIKNLRSIPGLKIYIIAIVVAGVTVVLPLMNAGIFPSHDQLIDFFQRFIIAIVLILPFEIRDMNLDTAELGTIPQELGVRGTKMLGYFLSLVFVLLEFLKKDIHLAHLISLLIFSVIGIIFLRKSTVAQGEYYASFWVEAAPWFWLVILFILKMFI